MKPYYERGGITIYHGDCREILPHLEAADAIVTDPVWPGASVPLAGSDRPLELFREVVALTSRLAPRLVVHLGCDSDPRFLLAVPPALPFLRACWLRYACPYYKGRVLYGSDVAYVFGAPPPASPGAMVLPGEVTIRDNSDKLPRGAHPCPRRLEGVAFLVKWFGGRSVIDPFAGAGTTLLACHNAGVRAVGIEIEERYCEVAARRLKQKVFDFEARTA